MDFRTSKSLKRNSERFSDRTVANPHPRTRGAPPVYVGTARSVQEDGSGSPQVSTKGGWAVGSHADLSRKPADHGKAGGRSGPPTSAELSESHGSFKADLTLANSKAKERSGENGRENIGVSNVERDVATRRAEGRREGGRRGGKRKWCTGGDPLRGKRSRAERIAKRMRERQATVRRNRIQERKTEKEPGSLAGKEGKDSQGRRPEETGSEGRCVEHAGSWCDVRTNRPNVKNRVHLHPGPGEAVGLCLAE